MILKNLKNILLLFILWVTNFTYSQTSIIPLQNNPVETFFKARAYDSVIHYLTKKQAIKKLSFREYFLLSRAYGRTEQYGNGYVLTSAMIRKAASANDTLNLLIAFNLKAEHITDLYKEKEGAKFCDSITPFFRPQDSISFMKLCFKCGMLYNYNNQPKKAYTAYKQITKKKYQNLSIYNNNFAIILERLKKYDEALVYLKKGLTKLAKTNPSINIRYNNIASIYLKKTNWKLAKTYLDSAHATYNVNSRLSNKKEIFHNYFILYKSQKKEALALQYADSIYDINELLLTSKVKEKIHSIEAAHKNESLLTKKVQSVDEKLTTSKKQILKGTLLLLLLLLFLIISLFIFKYYHIKTLYKSVLIKQKLYKTSLKQGNITHSLNILNQLITSKNPQSIRYLSKLSKLLRLILESSRKPLISLSDETDIIAFYLQLKNIETKNNFAFTVNIEESLKAHGIYIPPMIIQPFMELAINHNKENKTPENIIITINYHNKILSCDISSNSFPPITLKTLIEKTQKTLRIFSKRFNIPYGITIKNAKKEAQITLIIPYTIIKN